MDNYSVKFARATVSAGVAAGWSPTKSPPTRTRSPTRTDLLDSVAKSQANAAFICGPAMHRDVHGHHRSAASNAARDSDRKVILHSVNKNLRLATKKTLAGIAAANNGPYSDGRQFHMLSDPVPVARQSEKHTYGSGYSDTYSYTSAVTNNMGRVTGFNASSPHHATLSRPSYSASSSAQDCPSYQSHSYTRYLS